ncbi:hypothetical protein FRB99_005029 [Tulasnella sp. 403]|nr:hypothetical protein FRB99_005029 [Tulasnella sp. 403]
MASDREQLLSFGFPPDRVDWALKATSGRGLQPALDFLFENESKPVPDLSTDAEVKGSNAPTGGADAPMEEDDDEAAAIRASLGLPPTGDSSNAEGSTAAEGSGGTVQVANSIKCSQCGKVFRDMDLANFHAEKSGHDQFEESTEEIKPLTEEEKKERLEELRKKAAEKRAMKSVEDAKEARANELIRRKAGQDRGAAVEQMKIKEAERDAAKRKQEKIDDAKVRAAIKAQIEADKRERAEKAAKEKALREGREYSLGQAAESTSGSSSGQTATAPSNTPTLKGSEYKDTRLQVPRDQSLPPDPLTLGRLALREVAEFVAGQNASFGVDTISFAMQFPRKTFTRGDFGKTLKDLGLTPSATCKRCYGISKTKAIWLRLYRTLEGIINPHSRRVLDRPLSSYSSSDVEAMVLKMASLELIWASNNPQPRITRKLPLDLNLISLVPGGRWLLATASRPHWCVVCYDIHDLDRAPFDVIDASTLATFECSKPWWIVRGINGDAECLEFDLAITCIPEERVVTLIEPLPVGIWRVRYDDHDDKLVATLQSTLIVRGVELSTSMMSLRGSKYLRGRSLGIADSPMIEVFHWDQCDSTRRVKSNIKLDFYASTEPDRAAQLLPNDQVALFKRGAVYVYNIPEPLEYTITTIGPLPDVAPWWIYRYESPSPKHRIFVAPQLPFVQKLDQVACFSFYDSKTLHEVIIPDKRCTDSVRISTCDFGESSRYHDLYLGTRRGCKWEFVGKGFVIKLFGVWPRNAASQLAEVGLPIAMKSSLDCSKQHMAPESEYLDHETVRFSGWSYDEQSGVIVQRLKSPYIKILCFA